MKRSVRNSFAVARIGLATLVVYISLNYLHLLLDAVKTRLGFLNNNLYAFLAINVIVAILAYLSDKSGNDEPCAGYNSYGPEEYVARRNACHLDEEKRVEFHVLTPPEVEEVVSHPPIVEAKSLTTSNNDTHKSCHRRTRSELSNTTSDLTPTPPTVTIMHDLRPSVLPATGRKSCYQGEAERRAILERLNDEEFKLTMDNFISAKKKILRDENIASLSNEWNSYSFNSTVYITN